MVWKQISSPPFPHLAPTTVPPPVIGNDLKKQEQSFSTLTLHIQDSERKSQ
ncbi:hypothetical protein BgiMline_005198, partial [Biomphalaria glabrata]